MADPEKPAAAEPKPRGLTSAATKEAELRATITTQRDLLRKRDLQIQDLQRRLNEALARLNQIGVE